VRECGLTEWWPELTEQRQEIIMTRQKSKLSRTHFAHVCLNHTLVLIRVHDTRRVQCDGALGVLDDRCRTARREHGMQRCGLSAEVRHAPRDLA